MKPSIKSEIFVLTSIAKLREFGTTTLCRMLTEHRKNLTCHIELGVPKGSENPVVMDVTFNIKGTDMQYRTFTSLLNSMKGFKSFLSDTEALQNKLEELESKYNIIRGETEIIDFRNRTSANLFCVDFYICDEDRKEYIQESPHFELVASEEENEQNFHKAEKELHTPCTSKETSEYTGQIRGWGE